MNKLLVAVFDNETAADAGVPMAYCLVNRARPLIARERVHDALDLDYLRKYR